MTHVAFADVWARQVSERAGAPFLTFEQSGGGVRSWTYAEFDRDVRRVATTLHEGGVRRGDAVHLALANSPAFVAVWLAAVRLGAWIVPSDPMARTPELSSHIARTRPSLGVCADTRAEVYRAACGDLPVIEVDEDDVDLAAFAADALPGRPEVDLLDRAAVMFTSGTTGLPKGVEITQANYAFAGRVMAEAAGLTEHDRQLVVLPLFHANAQYYSFASAIWAGASVALMPSFSASGFLDQAGRHRVTCASMFAAPLRMVLARGRPVPDLALRHCWFAQSVSDEQYATLTQWLGCRPRQLYGMTETIPAVLTDAAADPVPASMGFVTPGCRVDVQDPHGNPCAPGVEGEIVVHGEPGLTLFAGYLDMPEITASSFRDGWFLTGDRAVRDASGRFVFAGRRSDVLKVAGENVSTVEVEQALSAHPGVLEAAVIGRPDPVRDEVPVAFVVTREAGGGPTPDELVAWCAERLGKAKVPRSITFVPELPRTSVGKIRKFLLASPEAEPGTVVTGGPS